LIPGVSRWRHVLAIGEFVGHGLADNYGSCAAQCSHDARILVRHEPRQNSRTRLGGDSLHMDDILDGDWDAKKWAGLLARPTRLIRPFGLSKRTALHYPDIRMNVRLSAPETLEGHAQDVNGANFAAVE